MTATRQILDTTNGHSRTREKAEAMPKTPTSPADLETQVRQLITAAHREGRPTPGTIHPGSAQFVDCAASSATTP